MLAPADLAPAPIRAAERGRVASNTIQSVERALDIMESIAGQTGESTLKAIAGRTGLKPATVRGLLLTLAARGYVLQEHDRGPYILGPKIADLALALEGRQHLRSVGLPVVRWLHGQSGETVSLSIVSGLRFTVIARLTSDHMLMVREVDAVSTQQMHATAQGKLVLAHLAAAEFAAYLRETTLPRFGPRTVADRQTLGEHLECIRQQGYSLTIDEMSEGSAAIAAPIRTHKGRLIGAIALTVPTIRLRDCEERLARLVCEAARSIEEKLGYLPGIVVE